jgi:hypothetical protein
VIVWGSNTARQLASEGEAVRTPTKIDSEATLLEVGECSLAYVKKLNTVVLSGLERFQRQEFQFSATVTDLACGDEFLSVLTGKVHTANNITYHLGGLFESPPPHSFLRLPLSNEVKRVELSFFPSKVLKLFGKYSYCCALLED